MSIDTIALKSIAYFAGLSQSELDSISPRIIEKKAERGEIILYDGEPAEALFFVISGTVKVFKTSADGKEQILSVVLPGGSFNDVPIFDSGANPASAQAMGPALLYQVRKNEFAGLLRTYPQLAFNTIKVLATQQRRMMELVEDLSFKHVIGRVAKILLGHTGDGANPGMKLTQQEMAALAGTAREVVGRSLKSLEDDGLIRLERHRILISNREALKNLIDAV